MERNCETCKYLRINQNTRTNKKRNIDCDKQQLSKIEILCMDQLEEIKCGFYEQREEVEQIQLF